MAKSDLKINQLTWSSGIIYKPGDVPYMELGVWNHGTGKAGAHTVRAFLSKDEFLDDSDILVFRSRSDGLKAGSFELHSDGALQLPDDVPGGSYMVISQVDPRGEVTESNEDNNTTIWDTVGIGDTSEIRYVVENDTVDALATASDIFAKQGHLVFMARMSQAAYHLRNELVGDRVNDVKVGAKGAYQSIQDDVKLLTAEDLPALKLEWVDSVFNVKGLRHGIYTKENAAALVARSKDALFIAFRGTNDNEGEAGYPANTPDEEDWDGIGLGAGKLDHWRQYGDLLEALRDYVGKASSGIKKVFVTGHSLGASMVEAYMEAPWV